MKLLSSYIKEMKIAARGFYFYIEIGIAVIMLLVLLLAVSDNPVSNEKSYLKNDLPEAATQAMIQTNIDKGNAKWAEDTEFELKPESFEVTNKETGEVTQYNFTETKTINVKTLENYDPKTKELASTDYFFEDEEDLIRVLYKKKQIGAVMSLSEEGELIHKYYLQGFETERMVDLLSVFNFGAISELEAASQEIEVRTLGSTVRLSNRENLVPAFLTFAGTLMGLFIVMAYIFLDKDEGVIKAFAVTPSSVWKYLMSKALIILTTVTVSSTIITIPVMGTQPNYLLFYPFLLITTFAFAALGLLVASFFDSISKSFGFMYGLMIVLMLPAFSYYIPSFDPLWLRFFPTYPVLQGYKEILLNSNQVGYVLMYCGIFLGAGILLFSLANQRFKKTLTV